MFKKERFRNWALVFILKLITIPCFADPIKVAVIDSGFNSTVGKEVKLCDKGHFDFFENKKGIGADNTYNLHGTKVAKTIAKYAQANYCIIIYKVINIGKEDAVPKIVNALYKAREDGASIINLSIGDGSELNVKEFSALWSVGESGIIINVAAGNHNQNFDLDCNEYPACYQRIKMIVVGSLKNGTSNYGKHVTRIENFCEKDFCGTSVSSAIASGKDIKKD